MKIGIYGLLGCLAWTICGSIGNSCLAQRQTNLISNPGFETPGFSFPWNAGSATTVSNSSAHKIDGQNSAQIDHGITASTTGFSQNIPMAGLTVGGRYVLSANVRHETAGGNVRLIVRFNNNSALDVDETFPVNINQWEQVQMDFEVPSGTTSVRVFYRLEGTTGKSFVDCVKLVEGGNITGGENLLVNEDFEDTASTPWNLAAGASISSTESRFGSKSLKLDGQAGSVKYATQFVNVGSLVTNPDQPVYTVSAHIKTTATTAPTRFDTWNYWPRVTGVTQLPDVPQVGAAIKIDCFAGATHLRTLYTPTYFSTSNQFTERKFSFLVPRGTTGIIISPMISNANMVAYFDNFRLTHWSVGGPALVEDVGVEATEAPEAGTYVLADASANNLQTLVDNSASSTHADYGKLIWLPEDDYSVNAKYLEIKSGVHLKMHKDSTVDRTADPVGPGMFYAAQLRNKNDHTPVSDVIIEGGVFDNASNWQGSAVGLTGDRVVLRNLNIPTWSKPSTALSSHASSALFCFGHDWYVYRNSITGPISAHGYDAIHVWGGSQYSIMSNDILAGDDAIGIFPIENGIASTLFDRDISEIEIYNNVLDSVNARTIGLGIAVPRMDTNRILAKVTDIRARNFEGLCGGRNQLFAIMCVPATEAYTGPVTDPDPQVQNIRIENANMEGYLYNTPDPVHPEYSGGNLDTDKKYPSIGIQIFTRDVGAVKDVWFENVSIKNFEDTFATPPVPSVGILVRKREFFDVGDPIALRKDNENIRFKSCTIDQATGPTADILYQIDGTKWDEVGVLEHPAWLNQLLGPGTRKWTDY